MKIINYFFITICIILTLFGLGIMILGGYYVGNNQAWLIKRYEFKATDKDLDKDLKVINNEIYAISTKDILLGDSLDPRSRTNPFVWFMIKE